MGNCKHIYKAKLSSHWLICEECGDRVSSRDIGVSLGPVIEDDSTDITFTGLEEDYTVYQKWLAGEIELEIPKDDIIPEGVTLRDIFDLYYLDKQELPVISAKNKQEQPLTGGATAPHPVGSEKEGLGKGSCPVTVKDTESDFY